VALVGRPNVGKSSLLNRVTGEDRSVVDEVAGTTVDPVDSLVELGGEVWRFVDTAGLRRPSRTSGVEYFSALRTVQAIERCDVAALVLDARDGLTTEDKKIAARVIELGRGLLVVANKWDLVEERDRAFRDLTRAAAPFARADVVRTSAVRGTGIGRVPELLLALHVRWSRRIPTARVNEVLELAQADRPPPRGAGRFRYATQVSSGPPSFVLFGGPPPEASYRRYLEGRLRREFDLDGVPVELTFRARRRRPGGT
jgi:GTP-binding protein